MKSMTGFGSDEQDGERGTIRVEMRSYNHRFLDLRLRVSRALQPLEPRIYAWARDRLVRGRVEVNVQYDEQGGGAEPFRLNEEALRFYMDLAKRLREEFGVKGTLGLETLMRLRDLVILTEGNPDLEEEWPHLLQASERAVEKMEEMQETEGGVLREDLLTRVKRLLEKLEEIRSASKDVPNRFRERLEERISNLLNPDAYDPQRIAQEIVLYTDKTDITEEIVRLSSHLKACEQALTDGSMTGKRLEFLAQEVYREVNTIGSKTPCADITYLVVDMKSELEKVREQSQNLQ
jgi:uncharacterized protein (TIGR00255 family)